MRLKETPSISQNLPPNFNGLTHGKEQFMKIAANDLHQFDIEEENDSEVGNDKSNTLH